MSIPSLTSSYIQVGQSTAGSDRHATPRAGNGDLRQWMNVGAAVARSSAYREGGGTAAAAAVAAAAAEPCQQPTSDTTLSAGAETFLSYRSLSLLVSFSVHSLGRSVGFSSC